MINHQLHRPLHLVVGNRIQQLVVLAARQSRMMRLALAAARVLIQRHYQGRTGNDFMQKGGQHRLVGQFADQQVKLAGQTNTQALLALLNCLMFPLQMFLQQGLFARGAFTGQLAHQLGFNQAAGLKNFPRFFR